MISIIVPVYKVEPYLDACVRSLVEQTESDLEIILVDDGSPDSCGIMCDEYERRDHRIKTIHKLQGGLSDTRNVGLGAATGDYVAFVDSDDYVSVTMMESLRRNLEDSNADIAICGHTRTNEQGKPRFALSPYIRRKRVFGSREGFSDLLAISGYGSFSWNKLYKRELFDDVRFPVGRLYEDMATTYKLFYKADKLVYDPGIQYFYRQRKSSIIHRMTWKKSKDFFYSASELRDFTKEHYTGLSFLADFLVFRARGTVFFYRCVGYCERIAETLRRKLFNNGQDRENMVLAHSKKEKTEH